MTLRELPGAFSVCLLPSLDGVDRSALPVFIGMSEEEISWIGPTAAVPADFLRREDGWRGLYIDGTLDFSLIGVLAGITRVLADAGIALLAASTYQTDYIFVKEDRFSDAAAALRQAGYTVA